MALIKFANMSLHVKMHQEKKTAIKKNSTVIDRESDSLSITVEFLIGFFFLGALLHANSMYLPPPYSFYGEITGSRSIDFP